MQKCPGSSVEFACISILKPEWLYQVPITSPTYSPTDFYNLSSRAIKRKNVLKLSNIVKEDEGVYVCSGFFKDRMIGAQGHLFVRGWYKAK